MFETNIRYVGGLLSLYSFTGDDMFKEKAIHIVDKLMPAFRTPTGIPYALINMRTGVSILIWVCPSIESGDPIIKKQLN